MDYKPGQSGNPNGRPKGSKNKFSTLKQAFVDVFTELGGADGLREWITQREKQVRFRKGKKIQVELDFSGERKKEFYKMVSAMLPKDVQISGPGGAPLVPPQLTLNFVNSNGNKSNGDQPSSSPAGEKG